MLGKEISMYHFIISDKNNEERHHNIEKECAKLGIKPCFFDAIMGGNLTEEELNAAIQDRRLLSLGEIGCALSHLEVLKKFLASEEEVALILEDDIIFSEALTLPLLEELKAWVKAQAGGCVIALYSENYKKKKVENIQDFSIYAAHHFWCSHAYFINREAAKGILEIQQPLAFVYDCFKYYYWLDACKIYCLDKDLILQREDLVPTIEHKTGKESTRELWKKSFQKLFWSLPLKRKLLVMKRRLEKHFPS